MKTLEKINLILVKDLNLLNNEKYKLENPNQIDLIKKKFFCLNCIIQESDFLKFSDFWDSQTERKLFLENFNSNFPLNVPIIEKEFGVNANKIYFFNFIKIILIKNPMLREKFMNLFLSFKNKDFSEMKEKFIVEFNAYSNKFFEEILNFKNDKISIGFQFYNDKPLFSNNQKILSKKYSEENNYCFFFINLIEQYFEFSFCKNDENFYIVNFFQKFGSINFELFKFIINFFFTTKMNTDFKILKIFLTFDEIKNIFFENFIDLLKNQKISLFCQLLLFDFESGFSNYEIEFNKIYLDNMNYTKVFFDKISKGLIFKSQLPFLKS